MNRTSSGKEKRISEGQPECQHPMYIDKSFMKILIACRGLCVHYLKIFDDVNYWKNVVNQIEKGLKTERKMQQTTSDTRQTELPQKKLQSPLSMSPQNIVHTPSQLNSNKRINQSLVIDGSLLKSFHHQSVDNLKGFDPTQSIVFNSKVFHDSKENSPITSPRRQSIVSEYTNYSEYTDLLKSNLKNKQITNSQMSLPENLEDNQAL